MRRQHRFDGRALHARDVGKHGVGVHHRPESGDHVRRHVNRHRNDDELRAAENLFGPVPVVFFENAHFAPVRGKEALQNPPHAARTAHEDDGRFRGVGARGEALRRRLILSRFRHFMRGFARFPVRLQSELQLARRTGDGGSGRGFGRSSINRRLQAFEAREKVRARLGVARKEPELFFRTF